MSNARAHVLIKGRVQGVYFRSYTRSEAERLSLNGWVRNLHDGSVEAVFEGEKASVEKMIAWCQKGPPGAIVTNAEIEWQDYAGEFDGFSVEHSRH